MTRSCARTSSIVAAGIVWLLGALLAPIAAAAAAPAPVPDVAAIILGDVMSQGEFETNWRSTVSIQETGRGSARERHVCGGVHIAPGWVLTARHCIDEGGWISVSRRLEVRAEHDLRAQLPQRL